MAEPESDRVIDRIIEVQRHIGRIRAHLGFLERVVQGLLDEVRQEELEATLNMTVGPRGSP